MDSNPSTWTRRIGAAECIYSLPVGTASTVSPSGQKPRASDQGMRAGPAFQLHACVQTNPDDDDDKLLINNLSNQSIMFV